MSLKFCLSLLMIHITSRVSNGWMDCHGVVVGIVGVGFVEWVSEWVVECFSIH